MKHSSAALKVKAASYPSISATVLHQMKLQYKYGTKEIDLSKYV